MRIGLSGSCGCSHTIRGCTSHPIEYFPGRVATHIGAFLEGGAKPIWPVGYRIAKLYNLGKGFKMGC